MNDRGWPDPRTWVGDSPFPWPAAAWLDPGDLHVACYAVISAGMAHDAAGRPVMELELRDTRGTVAGRIPAVHDLEWLRAGLYVGVRGIIADAGRSVLEITDISPVTVGLDDLALFLPHSVADAAVLEDELARLIGSIEHDLLRSVCERLLGDDSETGRGFRLAPAASRNHHACLGGLFEHTVSVARLCEFAAAHYGDAVDRDLLLTGALLHDIGKIREIGARAGFPYTDEGRLLGHIILGLRMVGEAARDAGLDAGTRLLLEHLVASHQGRYEWQSPREPLIIEAFILHHIDDLDAKIDHARGVLESVDVGWTPYDRSLRRDLLRHGHADRPAPAGGPTGSAGSSSRGPARPARSPAEAPRSRQESRGRRTDTPGSGKDTPRSRTGSPESRTDSPAREAEPGSSGGADASPTPRKPGGRGLTGTKKRATKRKRPKKKAAKKTRKRATKRNRPTQRTASHSGTAGTSAPPPPRSIVEPGMPGFIDRDTLDLFEQD